jgi:histidinol-phosphate aminotransferase
VNNAPRIHGGPDGQGAPLYDFSTNSNACGPCPTAQVAVQQADATRYPDPSYTALRQSLADFYGVDAVRILLAGSASECIFRITAWVRQRGGNTVHIPKHAYGDYGHAAQAWGMQAVSAPDVADLVWACEPSSPLGQNHGAWPAWLDGSDALATDENNSKSQVIVVDCAYAPLRLDGEPSLDAAQNQRVWQLFSPNKALGLTGVRAAFAIAPIGAEATVAQLDALTPSWVLGAHGVAMLQAWTQATTQEWLQDSLYALRGWKARQQTLLQDLGWTVQASDTPFFCARPLSGVDATQLCGQLRAQGIKLRDATSFGLPGWVRISVQAPKSQDALRATLHTSLEISHAS